MTLGSCWISLWLSFLICKWDNSRVVVGVKWAVRQAGFQLRRGQIEVWARARRIERLVAFGMSESWQVQWPLERAILCQYVWGWLRWGSGGSEQALVLVWEVKQGFSQLVGVQIECVRLQGGGQCMLGKEPGPTWGGLGLGFSLSGGILRNPG